MHKWLIIYLWEGENINQANLKKKKNEKMNDDYNNIHWWYI